jgi:hypothetical protein
VSNPESTTILDNYTVIAPFSWPSTKRAAEDYERRISGSYPSALKAREIAARVGVASTTFILGSADYRIGELCGDTNQENVNWERKGIRKLKSRFLKAHRH